MATVNYIPCKKQNASSMQNTISYILQDFKACVRPENLDRIHAQAYCEIEESVRKQMDYSGCVKLVSGKDCCPETAFNEFMATKKSYGKANGMFFYHYDQSFERSEKLSPKTAHEIAVKFAEDNYPGFEVLVSTHMDKKHLHSHFIINSVSFENGKKLHQGTDTIQKLRAYSDEICKKHGLSVLKPYEHGRTKTIGSGEYRSAMRENSWKFKLLYAADGCMKRSRTKRQFIENMNRLGYGVAWTDTRKSICYTTPNGYKCRDDRLHEEKYLKGNMENEFRIRATQSKKRRGFIGDRETVSVHRLRRSEGAMASDDQFVGEQPGDDTRPLDRRRFDASYQPHHQTGTEYDEQGNGGGGFGGRENDRGADEADLTGWELSRAEFDNADGADDFTTEPISADAIEAVERGEMVFDRSDGIVGDAVRLAHQVSKIADTNPKHRQTPKTVKERKKGIGQREDDHSGDFEQTMG
ncbi:MAG: relaxase/mobilization nuclease domain-containing protein [Eubacteriales bacterium]|nr:relaxase/mobilization nuclease domain-containing protein [Eubacteriales bacterium]